MPIFKSSMPSGPGWTPFMTVTGLNGLSVTVAGNAPRPALPVTAPSLPLVNITPVTPTIDPKIDANALIGKPKLIWSGGLARIGAPGAPLVGPYTNNGRVDLIAWLGYRVPLNGSAVLFDIALDNEIWWRANDQVAGGTQPSDGTFAEPDTGTFAFRQGTLTQSVLSLESERFGVDANAYRPGTVLELRGVPYQRYLDRSGRPVPYVAPLIGDTTDGANPHDGINLGTALERIARSPWARYTADTFEAVGITDVVGAVLIKENFNVIDICRAITQGYPNIDLLVSDKVRIKDRGSNVTPDIVLTRNTIYADDPLTIARGEATAMPRQEELITVASDADYTIGTALSQWPRDPIPVSAAVGKVTTTLPVAIDASTRQALATYMRFARANDRKQSRLTATGAGYRAMPGDLIGITGLNNGVANQVLKLRDTTHGANWCVEMGLGGVLRCRSGYEPPSSQFRQLYVATFLGVSPVRYHRTDVDLGDEALDRVIVLHVASIRSIPNARTIQSVTIAGVSATLYEHTIQNGSGGAGGSISSVIAVAEVPSGTTGQTVILQVDGLLSAIFFGVYRLTGLSSVVPFDQASGVAFSGDPSLSLNVPSIGTVVAGYAGCDPGVAAVAWDGLDTITYGQQIDATNNGFWGAGAMQALMTSQTGRPISVASGDLGAEVLIGASFI